MSKAYSTTLFQLIQALSQTEKRYVKVFLQKQVLGDTRNYLALFDALAKQKVFNEEKLLAFKHLAVMKLRLEENVLLGLQRYYSEKSVSAKLYRDIHSVEILFQKGLFENAMRQITKSKKTAIYYQEHTALFELTKWELKVINAQGFAAVSQEEMKSKYREAENSLKELINAHQYSLFSNTVYLRIRKFGFFRSRAELKKFGRMMQHPLLKSEEKAVSVESKYYFYSTRIGYANLEGDYQKAFTNTNKIIKILEEHPQLIEKEPRQYLAMQQNASVWQYNFKEYEQTYILLEKLKEFLIGQRTSLSKNLFSRTFYYVNTVMLYVYNRTGEFEKGVKAVPVLQKEFVKYKITPLSVEEKWMFDEAVAAVYFGNRNYSKSIEFLNKIINDKAPDVRGDMQCMARIFSLLVHYEMGNRDLLRYMVKWTYHFLSKRKMLYKFEQIILDFISKKSRKMDTRKKTTEAFKELKKDLEKLLPDPYQRRPLDDFEYIEWLDSKIQNRPFADLIKEKNQKKISTT